MFALAMAVAVAVAAMAVIAPLHAEAIAGSHPPSPAAVSGTSNASSVNTSIFLNTTVWYGKVGDPLSAVFPEMKNPKIMAKKSVGLAFSGGGVRSYSLSIGFLRGLMELGLVQNARYISGISGGSWATAVFSLYKRGAPGIALTDEELLSNITDPKDITMDVLNKLDPTCALYLTTSSLVDKLLVNIIKYPGRDVWARSISELYLEPVGIPWESFIALDKEHESAIKKKNIMINESNFAVLVDDNRPFPVIGTTFLGPDGLYWEKESNRSYTLTEASPLYVGQPYTKDITYKSGFGDAEVVTVGGYIEPFAVGSAPPRAGTVPTASGGSTFVEVGGRPYYTADIFGSSSFIAGGALNTLPVPGIKNLEMEYDYWPAGVANPPQTLMQYGDGGCIENVPLISLIRRKVDSVVVFANFEASMAGSASWNPNTDPDDNHSKNIDNDITAYFGLGSGMSGDGFGYDVSRNQIFDPTYFAPVIGALQKSQASGKGAVASTRLTTVENKWWGVPAGFEVNVTWVYLSRAFAWESQIPESVRSLIVPKKDPQNPQSTPTSGPFKNFPHFDDGTQYVFTPAQTNLLKDLAGWIVKENSDIFKAALS